MYKHKQNLVYLSIYACHVYVYMHVYECTYMHSLHTNIIFNSEYMNEQYTYLSSLVHVVGDLPYVFTACFRILHSIYI